MLSANRRSGLRLRYTSVILNKVFPTLSNPNKENIYKIRHMN